MIFTEILHNFKIKAYSKSLLAYHIMVEKQRAAGQLGQTPVQLTPTQVHLRKISFS